MVFLRMRKVFLLEMYYPQIYCNRKGVGEMGVNNNVSLSSVIVPIYNVENYLRRCVDSISNQTYENLEMIFVDDGSTDNGGMEEKNGTDFSYM